MRREVSTKNHLDTRIAAWVDMAPVDVSLCTGLFLRELVIDLVKTGTVVLPGFGTLTLRPYKGKVNGQEVDKVRVDVTKGTAFYRMLKRYGIPEVVMEKYGVDEGKWDVEAMEKAAAKGCPQCGAKVQMFGQIVKCPNCGTEPFEKKDG